MMRVVVATALLLCCIPSTATAQSPIIVVAPISDFAQHVADRLRAGLEWQVDAPLIHLSATSTSCDALAAAPSSGVTINITIGDDGFVQLCVRSAAGFSPRVLGPFPALDAAAVEQIATVVEASLDAIRSPLPPPTPVIATPSTTHVAPIGVQPLPDEPSPPQRQRQVTPTRRRAPSPSATAHADVDRNEPAPRHALTFGYQLMLWNGDALVHGAHIGAQRLMVSPWLWLGGGLGLTLPFDTINGAIGARFWAFAIDLCLGVRVAVRSDVVIDLSVGPRLEWLSVSTLADQMAGARAAPGSTDLALTSIVAVVPRFAVTSNLSLAFGVGAIFTHNPRAYAFDQGGQFVVLMDQGIPRVYAHVGALLAL